MTFSQPKDALCDQAADLILSREWSNLPPGNPLRSHIGGCSICRERVEEVAFFDSVFGGVGDEAFLVKEPSRSLPAPSRVVDWEAMRNRALSISRAAAVFAAVFCVAFVVWKLIQPAGIGLIEQVRGEASVRRYGERDFTSLREGDRVHPGDYIETNSGSAVRLALEHDNVVFMNESTQLRVEESRELEQGSGEIWLEIAKGHGEFEVETRGADVLVLGTEFGIHYQRDEVHVSVASGRVRLLTKGGDLELAMGQAGAFSSSKPYLPPVRQGTSLSGPRPEWVSQLEALR